MKLVRLNACADPSEHCVGILDDQQVGAFLMLPTKTGVSAYSLCDVILQVNRYGEVKEIVKDRYGITPKDMVELIESMKRKQRG